MLWGFIIEHTPSGAAWFYTALCAIAPYLANRINRKLRELTDPPWKRKSDTEK